MTTVSSRRRFLQGAAAAAPVAAAPIAATAGEDADSHLIYLGKQFDKAVEALHRHNELCFNEANAAIEAAMEADRIAAGLPGNQAAWSGADAAQYWEIWKRHHAQPPFGPIYGEGCGLNEAVGELMEQIYKERATTARGVAVKARIAMYNLSDFVEPASDIERHGMPLNSWQAIIALNAIQSAAALG